MVVFTIAAIPCATEAVAIVTHRDASAVARCVLTSMHL